VKQTLQLKLSQHLTLTPQLQQSIRLLQLSTLELNAEVERMLQENPLLEKEEAEGEEEPPQEFPLATRERPAEPEHESRGGDDEPEERPLDVTQAADPSDVADYTSPDTDWGGGAPPDDDEFYPQQAATSSLRDHLLEQLSLLNLDGRDREIVGTLIDAVNEDGYLTSTLEEIAEMFPADAELGEDRVQHTWSKHPHGVLVVATLRMMALAILAVARQLSCLGYSKEHPTWDQVAMHFLLQLGAGSLETSAFDDV